MAAAAVPRGIPRVMNELDDCPVVIAVDMGTYASGFCIAFRPRTGVEDPSTVMINMCSPGETAVAASHKNLTAVLLDAHTHTPTHIGAAARRRFADACDDGKQASRMHSRRRLRFADFKMNLAPGKRKEHPFRATIVGAGANATVPLMLPFSKFLQAVKEDALSRMATIATEPIDASKVGWVLTVPAIWDDEAKAFMRSAAKEAGMIDSTESTRLILALEPEGAAIASMMDSVPAVREKFKIGERMMVLDCGGGTVDITVSEIRAEKPMQLREILGASGGPWGGVFVDHAFLSFVAGILGGDFAKVDQASRVELLDAWEQVKRKFDPRAGELEYRLDFSCIERCLEEPGTRIEAALASYCSSKGWTAADDMVVRTRRGALILSKKLLQSFFDPLIDNTVAHVRKLLDDAKAKGTAVRFILLVGGFAESPYLQERINSAFSSSCTVIIPPRPQQVVNKGACQFALYARAFIQSRVARCTYAVLVSERWDPIRHAGYESLKFRPDESDQDYCSNVLSPLVNIGDTVQIDKPACTDLFAITRSQLKVLVCIYKLDESLAGLRKPRLIQSSEAPAIPHLVPTSAKLCDVSVRVADSVSVPVADRAVEVQLFFGRTEITAQVVGKKTGDVKYASISYTA